MGYWEEGNEVRIILYLCPKRAAGSQMWSCLGGSVGTEGIERGSRHDQSVAGEERKIISERTCLQVAVKSQKRAAGGVNCCTIDVGKNQYRYLWTGPAFQGGR